MLVSGVVEVLGVGDNGGGDNLSLVNNSNDEAVDTENTSHDTGNQRLEDQVVSDDTDGADTDSGFGGSVRGTEVSKHEGSSETQYTFFGYMGITAALVFGNFGAAYGTAKSGVGVCSAVVLKPELLFKSIIPIVMAGILGIYGLIVAVLFNGEIK